ncbi:chorismate mutase [Brucella endophytica]|uniref:chorismate mutase n=1 Tax=Brucella endophytica TaxID=1963359 RepID=A0A916WD74_9HYPH|nr:chorismate mutase [Brucella endophytica]GGA87786.1 chorismate mutase [Brucella endophytica]
MDESEIKAELSSYRQSIDNLDTALIHILAERFRCTGKVGRLKARHRLPSVDPAREELQVARLRHLAEQAGLDPDFAERLLGFIIEEVIRNHEQIAADETAAQQETRGNGR